MINMIERTEKNVFSQSRDSRWKEIETAFFIVVLKIFSVNSVVVYIVFFFLFMFTLNATVLELL